MEEVSRRSFVDTVLFSAVAAVVLATLAPIPFYLLPVERVERRRRMVAGRFSELAPGTSAKVDYGGVPVLMVNDAGTLKVFDARCPHLGCPVAWEAKESIIRCHCHGGMFDREGEPTGGPPTRPLARVPFSMSPTSEIILGSE